MNLNLNELQELKFALDDVIGYETDNSCGEPDCCGEPFYDEDDYNEGLKVLFKFGIQYRE